ncbi:DUF4417 domain-containing protein [Cetobacterium sp.]|uniref:DUF4417 domain-containing protein n=1 Tax=Cetobacterium sp. TaxID=2071632 RepID=UPI002FC96B51
MYIRDNLNWMKLDFEQRGKYGMPKLLKQNFNYIESEFIPFNMVMTCKEPHDKGVHFYIHDYQFERFWRNPERYINILKNFKYVIMPDFSLYTDYPKALQIFNVYRNLWLARYMQENNISVIFNIACSTEETNKLLLEVMPKNSIVAISSVGVMKNLYHKKEFERNVRQVLENVKLTQLIWFGKSIDKLKVRKIHKVKAYYSKFDITARGDV